MAVELRGRQVEALRDALVHAFPSWRDLAQLLLFELDEELARVAGEGPLADVAFDLLAWARKEGRVDDLLAASLRRRPGNPRLKSFAYELTLTSGPPPGGRLEALVVGGVPFADVAGWRERMAAIERAVCLVEDGQGRGVGTGFLVGPRAVLTNCHVVQEVERRGGVHEARLRFDFVATAEGAAAPAPIHAGLAAAWEVHRSEVAALDYALLRLAAPVPVSPGAGAGDRGWLAPVAHAFARDEVQLILQHPGAEELKLAAGVVTAFDPLHQRVTYTTNTMPGSSGSPVFTLGWDLVALHHFGAQSGNMGISLAAVWEHLAAAGRLGGDDAIPPLALVAGTPRPVPLRLASPSAAAPAAAPAAPPDPAAGRRDGPLPRALELRDAAVGGALAAFRALLAGAEGRLQRVADLKDVHDRLHDLQFRCYEPILGASRLFPGDLAVEELSLYASSLDGELRRLRALAARPSLAERNFAWVEDEVGACSARLPDVVAARDVEGLQQLVRRLGNVIQLRPTLCNELLVQAVEQLDLPSLVERVRALGRELVGVGASEEERRPVESSAGELERLATSLHAVLASHRAWQAVDNGLRMLDAGRSSSEERGRAWAVVVRDMDRVVASDEGAAELPRLVAVVDRAVASGEEVRIATLLPKVRTLAGYRFYQVDKELKGLCDRLPPLGRELGSALPRIA
jgi:hypothetical protein